MQGWLRIRNIANAGLAKDPQHCNVGLDKDPIPLLLSLTSYCDYSVHP